jgi:hypothetical protein
LIDGSTYTAEIEAIKQHLVKHETEPTLENVKHHLINHLLLPIELMKEPERRSFFGQKAPNVVINNGHALQTKSKGPRSCALATIDLRDRLRLNYQ